MSSDSWTTADYAPPHTPIDPATGELWRCETCPNFTRWLGPPWGNFGTCAELKRLKLDSNVTIPGSCVVDRRLALAAEHARVLAAARRS